MFIVMGNLGFLSPINGHVFLVCTPKQRRNKNVVNIRVYSILVLDLTKLDELDLSNYT